MLLLVSIAVGAPPEDWRCSEGPAPSGTPDTALHPAISRVLHDGSRQIRHCYERALKTDTSLAGALDLTLTIDGGTVRIAAVTENTIDNDVLEACVWRSACTWRFPEATTGKLILPMSLTAE